VTNNMTGIASYSYDNSTQELISYDTPKIVIAKAQYVVKKGLSGAMYWEIAADKTGSDSLIGSAGGVFGHLDQTPNHLNYPGSIYDNIRTNMGSNQAGLTITASLIFSVLPIAPTPTQATSNSPASILKITTTTTTPTSTPKVSTTAIKSPTTTSKPIQSTRTSTLDSGHGVDGTTTRKAAPTVSAPSEGKESCSHLAEWNESRTYRLGDAVIYHHRKWVMKKHSDRGQTPGEKGHGWEDSGPC